MPDETVNTSDLSLAASSMLQQQMQEMQGLPQPIMAPQLPQPHMPARYQAPQDAFKIPQQQGGFATVGERKRAQKQALFGGLSQMVHAATQFQQQKKEITLQGDIERLLSASQGLSEAQAQGDQQGVQKNIRIINTIFSDSKKWKALAKAFSVDLLNPGKNKMELQARQQAFQNWDKQGRQGLNPDAQRFMQQMPQRMQENPQIGMLERLIKSGVLADAKTKLEVMQRDIASLRTATTAENKQTIAKEIANNIVELKKKGIDATKEMFNNKLTSAKDIANIKAHVALDVAREVTGRAIKVANIHAQALKDATVVKEAQGLYSNIIKTTDGIQKALNADNKVIDEVTKKIQNDPTLFNLQKSGLPSKELTDLQFQLSNAQSDAAMQTSRLKQNGQLLQSLVANGAVKLQQLQGDQQGGSGDTGSPDQPLDMSVPNVDTNIPTINLDSGDNNQSSMNE